MKKILTMGLFCIAGYVNAAAPCLTSTSTLPSVDSVYKSGKFRIYYNSNPANENYLVDRTDLNSNGIPDYVENMAIQANATTEALTHLGFTHPLESNRYKGVAQYIDIHLIKQTGNGVAYEMAQNFVNKAIKEGKCSLTIHIRNNLNDFPGDYVQGSPENYWTIATHEIFHLYQYGSNQFKGGWYLEGMTYLMERLLREGSQGGSGLTKLPASQAQMESAVYTVPFNQLWHRLAVLSDNSNGQLNLPSELLNRRYIDGSKVFKDEKLKGHMFIKKALENMELKTDHLSAINGWDKHNWAEANQISPLNRPHMLKVIQETMYQFGMNKTQEEKDFLKLY
ncbi:hypothetical protein [Acinetobacter rudis]|uniref:hypothetical protein n=1 Tax=Acinetobacter rudis TaxID=632955 RepID=UPI0033422FF5